MDLDRERAEQLLDLGRPAQALTLLSQHLSRYPDDVDALCLVAQAHLDLDEDSKALAACGRACALDPTAEWPHRLAASALLCLAQFERAVGAAREAVRLEPGSWQTHFVLSRAEGCAAMIKDRGGRRRAVSYAAACTAVQLAPHEASAHYAVGESLILHKNTAGAEAALRAALQLQPDHSLAREALVRLSHRRGRLSHALRLALSGSGSVDDLQNVEQAVERSGLGLLRRLQAGLVALLATAAWSVSSGEMPALLTAALLAATTCVAILLAARTWRSWPSVGRAALRTAARRGWGLAAAFSTLVSAILVVAAPLMDEVSRLVLAMAALALVFGFGFSACFRVRREILGRPRPVSWGIVALLAVLPVALALLPAEVVRSIDWGELRALPFVASIAVAVGVRQAGSAMFWECIALTHNSWVRLAGLLLVLAAAAGGFHVASLTGQFDSKGQLDAGLVAALLLAGTGALSAALVGYVQARRHGRLGPAAR